MPDHHPLRRPRLVAGLGALAAGGLLCLSLPPFGWWPLAFLGLAGLDRLIADQPVGVRFRRGWLVAMGCFVPSLSWMTALTVPGYLVACVAYAAMLGAGVAAAPPGRGRWLALVGTWTVAELVRWSWPFGGVPLANLAIGQVAGPLAPVLRVGGAVLLLAVTVALGQALAAGLRRAWAPAVGLAAGVAVLVAAAALAPQGGSVDDVEVALVQGGGKQGTRKSETGVVEPFERHVEATEEVRAPVDLVVWPEDVIDTDGAFVDDPWFDVVASIADELGAPMVVGTVEGAGAERFRNAAVLIGPDGAVAGRYEKVHRVPFGEYVPLRGLLEPIAGDALPDRDAISGDEPNLLDVPGPVGLVTSPISWEIFFADRTREGVEAGARLVLNPTNGSSFTGTIVQTQQVASSRMRAIESGRWVVQVAPTGFSAVIDERGRVVERTAISERRVLQRPVELRDGLTLYTRWGNAPGLIVAALCIAAGWVLERRRRPDPAPTDPKDGAVGT
ncbi:MAG: apolipoprotein N-acyltransferase [Acidimicrobiia bacterium]